MRDSIRIEILLLAVAAMSVVSGIAAALDWRIIQDQLGAEASQVYPRGKVLFAEDFERATLGKNHPGVTLVKNSRGKGSSARFSTSAYQMKDIRVLSGHWIVVGWKSRTLSGDGAGGAFVEIIYKDAKGKTLFTMGRLLTTIFSWHRIPGT